MIHDIELPHRIVKGRNCLEKTRDLMEEFKFKNPAIVSGETTRKIAGEKVSSLVGGRVIECPEATTSEVEKVKKESADADLLVGVGGGSVIDVAKVAAFQLNKPFFSVPTAPSHDGISSSRASIKNGKSKCSIKTRPPLAIVCDVGVIEKAPKKLIAAGYGDAISNYTAVLDWKLAEESGEYYGDYAAALALLSAETIIKNVDKMVADKEFAVNLLLESLISSGIAMCIAGSSRPCSGAEHLFSHSLDEILEEPAAHGSQCGVGAIMMAKLHGKDFKLIKSVLSRLGAPTTAKELGIPEEKVVEALVKAREIREQTTVLGGGLNEEQARKLAFETGVIEGVK